MSVELSRTPPRSWLGRAATSLIALAIVLLALAPATLASSPAANGMLAWPTRQYQDLQGPKFVSYSIVVANADGSNVTPITLNESSDPYQDVGAVWSPDGNRLAVVRCANNLFGCNTLTAIDIINADGTGRRTLVSNATWPSWSPDGTKLVFAGSPDYASGTWGSIHTINADGTGLQTVPIGCHPLAVPTRWYDAERLIFHNPCAEGTGWLTIELDSGDRTLLAASTSRGWDISPDRRTIVYSKSMGAPNGIQLMDLWSVDLDTGLHTRLTSTGPDTAGFDREDNPVYSPDGTKLAYFGPTAPGTQYAEIWVGPAADPSAGSPITTNRWQDGAPSWQPCIDGVTLRCEAPDPPPPPDGDGDGVPDASDSCPAQPGPASNDGCPVVVSPPDGDGDGVPNASDSCPAQPGPASNDGCPVSVTPPDRDHDGVADAVDACPDVAAPGRPFGCPTPNEGSAAVVDSTAPTIILPAGNRRIVANRSGVVRIMIGTSSEDASGRLSLKTAGKVKVSEDARPKVVALGSKSFRAVAGQPVTVTTTLGRAARELLHDRGRVRARATIALRDAAGNTTTRRYRLTIRVRKSR